MRLSISNIGWDALNDEFVYKLMQEKGYAGLEIAPTRLFEESPYDRLAEAKAWSEKLKRDFGLCVPSMQSIWYGRKEMLFGTKEERALLVDYTKKAIDFAIAIDCGNLVFGCPRNRNMNGDAEDADYLVGVRFFQELGDYAATKGTVIGMEANPTIYNTNYINDTISAINLIKQVDSKGFLLNLDIGTMIQNEESILDLIGNVKWINHVHISEPGLKPIAERAFHKDLKKILDDENYQGFVSIEMGKVDDMYVLESKLDYVRSVFA